MYPCPQLHVQVPMFPCLHLSRPCFHVSISPCLMFPCLLFACLHVSMSPYFYVSMFPCLLFFHVSMFPCLHIPCPCLHVPCPHVSMSPRFHVSMFPCLHVSMFPCFHVFVRNKQITIFSELQDSECLVNFPGIPRNYEQFPKKFRLPRNSSNSLPWAPLLLWDWFGHILWGQYAAFHPKISNIHWARRTEILTVYSVGDFKYLNFFFPPVSSSRHVRHTFWPV